MAVYDMSHLKVGDTVAVLSSSRGVLRMAKVVKMGRTLVHVEPAYGDKPDTFRIEGGHLNDDFGHTYIRTPAQQADTEQREKLQARMTALRFRVEGVSRLSTDQLERIVLIMEEGT